MNNNESNNSMFVNMFITDLVGCIDENSIKTVRDKLSVFIKDYDIKQKVIEDLLIDKGVYQCDDSRNDWYSCFRVKLFNWNIYGGI